MPSRPDLPPPLSPWHGLVLAGGYSRRMGTDKASMTWHGRPQAVHLTDLLVRAGAAAVYVACRPDQAGGFRAQGLRPLPDLVPDLGPMGGLLTAFAQAPERAWLAVAVDLPLLGGEALAALLAARRADRPAVAFARPGDRGPDPLAALWEAPMGPLLHAAWQQGELAPRRVFTQAGGYLLTAGDPDWLRNANRPADAAEIRQRLSG